MNLLEKRFKKTCNFYISNWHFTTMIMPYINKCIKKGSTIKTIFEDDIKSNVETLLSKLNLNQEDKNQILKINWNKTKFDFDSEIKGTNNIIIVKGSQNFIKNINIQLEGLNYKEQIQIINCYDLSEVSEKMEEILDLHDNVLNTSGEKKKDEVFKSYKNK